MSLSAATIWKVEVPEEVLDAVRGAEAMLCTVPVPAGFKRFLSCGAQLGHPMPREPDKLVVWYLTDEVTGSPEPRLLPLVLIPTGARSPRGFEHLAFLGTVQMPANSFGHSVFVLHVFADRVDVV